MILKKIRIKSFSNESVLRNFFTWNRPQELFRVEFSAKTDLSGGI